MLFAKSFYCKYVGEHVEKRAGGGVKAIRRLTLSGKGFHGFWMDVL